MTTPRAWVDKLTFSDNTTLTLDKSDIVLLVGPNNAGKSAALRAVRDKLKQPANTSPVVSAVSVSREGEQDDLLGWIASFARQDESSPADPIFQAFGMGIHISQTLLAEWRSIVGRALTILLPFVDCR